MDIKIVEKIQKLLALSESSNEHEAQVSMLKAQQMLIKHKLSLKEVREFKTFNSAIQEKKSTVSFTKAKWKSKLAELIAENFGCYHFFKTRYTHTITFFGREEDVAVCNIVLEYAVDCIDSVVKKLRYQYAKDGYSTRGLENDYAIGFISGLRKKFDEQKKANQEWGLVLVKDSEVVEAYSKKKFMRIIDTNTTFQGHSKVFEKGFEEGGKFSISDKITEGEIDGTLRLTEAMGGA
ncbi:DUF2786 domain-containing protein [Geosporobacter ferrireducens]|uniref:Uncharacterized protein n=1 Tax=Geosporobacter ferrireducens TaxID=1424294 RepID=A0A1D8GBT6_9FIRM|nr:DUF2786 domain-containing protein [Geosporobacter ferrireducens]AOT68369.1 hypothetical protein Gferi_01425 [Geosporobacter ferrireducens]MTI53814.1 DUF2786 domain-containing protein [Geosporobacter ferrireducens]